MRRLPESLLLGAVDRLELFWDILMLISPGYRHIAMPVEFNGSLLCGVRCT